MSRPAGYIDDWVRFDILLDFDAADSCAIFWQNGEFNPYADAEGGEGGLAQAHFWLCAATAAHSGTVYDDRLRITEVADEAEAPALVQSV